MVGNLLQLAGLPGDRELFEELLATPSARIERIVSTGQASPSGSWYDQPWHEWLLVLQGSAGVLFEHEAAPRDLVAGDHLFIPARRRHRVAWTDAHAATIWLAVHLPPRGDDPTAWPGTLRSDAER